MQLVSTKSVLDFIIASIGTYLVLQLTVRMLDTDLCAT